MTDEWGLIFASILSSSARTVFICFARNPAALATTRPDNLKRLMQVWLGRFYDMTTGGGNELLKADGGKSIKLLKFISHGLRVSKA